MQATERLYYSDPESLSVEARLLERRGAGADALLVFDRSPFYPEGGGQPADGGRIGGIPVVEVREEGPFVLHRLAAPLEARPGDTLLLEADGERRRDHAEQHSAQHLLSSLFLSMKGAATLSFHLGPERSTIDLEPAGLGPEELAEVEAAANRLIVRDLPLRTHLCPPEDPSSFPLRKRPPAGEEQLRVVEIDGVDWTPCCGTHVASTGRLGLAAILGVERYKGGSRVAFVAGGRARERYARLRREAGAAARALGTGLEGLAEEASRMAGLLAETQSARKALLAERAALEAELADLRGGEGFLCLELPGRGAEEAQELAKALAARGRPCLCLSLPELSACAAVPSPWRPDAVGGLGPLLKPACLAAGGKGGGGQAAFRGSFPDLAALRAFAAAARATMSY